MIIEIILYDRLFVYYYKCKCKGTTNLKLMLERIEWKRVNDTRRHEIYWVVMTQNCAVWGYVI